MSGGNSYFRMWVRMTMAPVADSGDDVDMDTPVWLRLVLQGGCGLWGGRGGTRPDNRRLIRPIRRRLAPL